MQTRRACRPIDRWNLLATSNQPVRKSRSGRRGRRCFANGKLPFAWRLDLPAPVAMRQLLASLLAVLGLMLFVSPGASAAPIAVLEFELNDLTLNPDVAAESARAASLRPLLVERLKEYHNIEVVDNPPRAAIEAEKGRGYLFDRPELAAEIGREGGAAWIVSGRLHKPSFLFVYLKAQLIDTGTGRVAADFVVEIKGQQNKITPKGIETLARQISDALDTLAAQPDLDRLALKH